MCSEYGKGLGQSSHMQTHQRANPEEKTLQMSRCMLTASVSTPPFLLMSPFTPGWICIDVVGIGRASVMS